MAQPIDKPAVADRRIEHGSSRSRTAKPVTVVVGRVEGNSGCAVGTDATGRC